MTNNDLTNSTMQAYDNPLFSTSTGGGGNVAGYSTEAPRFPFAGVFTGVAYNCQSLYAYERTDTVNAVARIASSKDFTILSETRETQERKATLDYRLLSDHVYYSSYLDAHKGGVGILGKKCFLKKFPLTDATNCWKVLVRGRVGRLCLSGPLGTIHIYAVYLDPSHKKYQKQCIATISKQFD